MPLGPLTTDAGRLARWIRSLRVLPLVTAGFVSLLLFNLAQTTSLVLVPFSRRSFRRFNRWCADTWWGWCVAAAERFNRTHVVVTGESLPPDDNALIISNHQQMPDILALMALAKSRGRLGDLKFFVKHALKWIPGVGWGMQFINCPFLRRDWTRDRATVGRTFETLVREQIPMWLVSFAEGTRATPEKIRKSAEWAVARGIDATRHVQIPRTKGFVATIEGLGDHLHAVYDVTIGYVGGVPTLWQYITGSVRRIHVHVRRFPATELPRLERDLQEWLLALYRDKDDLLEHFYTRGVFPDQPLPHDAVAISSPDLT
jgi:1-acyl-sn-glycerol-3-phosphate acyltransferase